MHVSIINLGNEKLRIESDNFEKELNILRTSNKSSTDYIQVLESENEYMKSQVENIRKLVPKHKLSMLEKQSPLNLINKQTQKGMIFI